MLCIAYIVVLYKQTHYYKYFVMAKDCIKQYLINYMIINKSRAQLVVL